jgi:hypothetical protein
MDTRSNRSPSATTAESDLRTKFLDAVEALWPGSTRIARLIEQHDEWLKKKKTNGVSWYDLKTQSMEESENNAGDDGIIWDSEPEND